MPPERRDPRHHDRGGYVNFHRGLLKRGTRFRLSVEVKFHGRIHKMHFDNACAVLPFFVAHSPLGVAAWSKRLRHALPVSFLSMPWLYRQVGPREWTCSCVLKGDGHKERA